MTKARRILTSASASAALAASALVLASPSGAASPNTPANKALFRSNCGSCHTLKAAGTHGNTGPNLNTTKVSLSRIISQITNGGRFMPPFSQSHGGRLTPAQIKSIASYIVAVR